MIDWTKPIQTEEGGIRARMICDDARLPYKATRVVLVQNDFLTQVFICSDDGVLLDNHGVKEGRMVNRDMRFSSSINLPKEPGLMHELNHSFPRNDFEKLTAAILLHVLQKLKDT